MSNQKFTKNELSLTLMYTLKCSKEQLVLITKALTGNLRPEEVETARELGLSLMSTNLQLLHEKADAAQHALGQATVK